MPHRLLTLALVALLTGCAAHPTRATDPEVPPHLSQAELFLSQLRPEDTNYQNSPSYVSFAHTTHENAECRTDCSGFVTAVLQHTYRLSEYQLRRRLGNERPLAHHFVAAIEAGPSFTNIKRIQDARPGDIIAIAYPSDHRNSGHVMILAAPPTPRVPSQPLIEGLSQWDLDVIDASASPHSSDSRLVPGQEPRTGAGRGTFRLYTTQDGAFAGYAWSDSPGSGFWPQAERHLVIGRYRS